MRLYGKNPIIERLKSAPETISRIYVRKGANLEQIAALSRQKDVEFLHMQEKKFDNFTNNIHCQGVVAEVSGFSYSSFEDMIDRQKHEMLSLILLDSVTDPQNLGSIIRSLACFGNFGLVIPKDKSAQVNETVLKVASGGESFVPVAQTGNLLVAMEKLKEKEYWVAGAVVESGSNIFKTELPSPVALILGSEGKGIRPAVLKHLDLKVTLPMPGAALSFNVAVACAIFCYEITRQKNKTGI